MKLLLTAATLLMVVILSPTVKAEELPILEQDEFAKLNVIIEKKEPEPSKPVEHIVVAGDTLGKLATVHNTTIQRLFAKNTNIAHPDIINVGDKLIVPLADEVLTERPYPATIVSSFSITEVPERSSPTRRASSVSRTVRGIGGLIGSIGRVRAGGNCVNEPGVNNPGRGNPITWAVLTQTPTIGATALWTYNHTGVVTGIWDNGDIEVRHQNFSGGRTRFARSEFRGFR